MPECKFQRNGTQILVIYFQISMLFHDGEFGILQASYWVNEGALLCTGKRCRWDCLQEVLRSWTRFRGEEFRIGKRRTCPVYVFSGRKESFWSCWCFVLRYFWRCSWFVLFPVEFYNCGSAYIAEEALNISDATFDIFHQDSYTLNNQFNYQANERNIMRDMTWKYFQFLTEFDWVI